MFDAILERLSRLAASPLSGTAYRAVNLRYVSTPLSAVGSIKAGGRFNPKDGFEALYLSENAETTLKEVQFQASSGGRFRARPNSPYVVFSIPFELQQVVDLSKPLTWKELGLELADLTGKWRLKQIRKKPILTQAIGEGLFAMGLEGLKFVSATDGRVNLAVFPANLKEGSSLEIRFEDRLLARLP